MSPHEQTAEQLRTLERQRLNALVTQDLALAERLHAPCFQLITPAGVSLDKAQYLQRVASGALRYLRWEPEAIAVRLAPGPGAPGMALLRYRATLQFPGEDGQGGTPFQCWHLDSYERAPDGGGYRDSWQLVWSQATRILPPARD
ncbi:UNVERIFIED_ORG: nuclear transport factor 2 family protein [Shinella sp. XGS7]|nr:nuclear transport factor 2 family protein [Shinella sp. XGS7]